jgi:hypothetical protein
MSNNRFLQSKEPNKSNRFDFLDSEEPNNKTRNKEKDKKNSHQYESSNNCFTKSSSKDNHALNDKQSDKHKREHRPRNSNHFKEVPIATPTEFIISDESFPSLNPIIEPSKNNSSNFKDALNQHNEIVVTEDITLGPGWIQIHKVNNHIVIKQANISPYDIKMQQIKELQEDPNYIMDRVITTMEKNWIKYKIEYDNIHGEGAYDDLHYLSPSYDSEYDTDEYDSLSEDNSDDFYED